MNLSETIDDTPEISADIDKETTKITNVTSADDKDTIPDESEIDASTTNEQPQRKRITWNMVFREVLFILALALTTYDALQNSPPKISKSPNAVPLFGKGSLVTDWYTGQLSSALSRIYSSEISFVMYYAPWDAESQHVSNEFEKVAQIMFKQVHFAAINCWHPGSECRVQHSKISVWPIIMVYTVHLKSVVYTGSKDTMSMVKFLRNVMNPIHRINNASENMNLITDCDVIVYGFDSTISRRKPVYYNEFYSAALKSLEFDPFGDVCYALYTSNMLHTQQMDVEEFPALKLRMWNETLIYPDDYNFNDEMILTWIWNVIHRKSSWHIPLWQKSFAMQSLFSSGPVMILFTPRNLYREWNPNYSLFRQVALEYSNCDNPMIHKTINYLSYQRRVYVEDDAKLVKDCLNWREEYMANKKISLSKVKIESVGKSKWLNRTVQKNKLNDQTLHNYWFMSGEHMYSEAKTEFMDVVGFPKCLLKSVDDSCPSVDIDVKNIITKAVPEDIGFNYETSMLSQDEPRSTINLIKRKIKERCILLELASEYHSPVYPEMSTERWHKIEGISCGLNRTLSFVAIDSISGHHFAESLGIDIINKIDRTEVVILDNERESQYILNEAYGERSLRDFIYNFSNDLLTRNLRSVLSNTKYTHYYGSDAVRKLSCSNYCDSDVARETHHSNYDLENMDKSVNSHCKSTASGNVNNVFVYELTTPSFDNFIMQPNKGVLVALCSGGTGACGGILSLVLLTVNRILGAPGLISVGRIDSSKHDLPWQHTPPKYPSLLYYPMTRKTEFFAYPENEKITIEGVLAFILSGMEPPLKLYAQILMCNQTRSAESMKDCLSNVRNDTVSLIGKVLTQLRRFNNTSIRKLLLKRLEYLQSLYISLGALNTVRLPSDHHILRTFKQAIEALIRIWNFSIDSSKARSYEPFINANKHL